MLSILHAECYSETFAHQFCYKSSSSRVRAQRCHLRSRCLAIMLQMFQKLRSLPLDMVVDCMVMRERTFGFLSVWYNFSLSSLFHAYVLCIIGK